MTKKCHVMLTVPDLEEFSTGRFPHVEVQAGTLVNLTRSEFKVKDGDTCLRQGPWGLAQEVSIGLTRSEFKVKDRDTCLRQGSWGLAQEVSRADCSGLGRIFDGRLTSRSRSRRGLSHIRGEKMKLL